MRRKEDEWMKNITELSIILWAVKHESIDFSVCLPGCPGKIECIGVCTHTHGHEHAHTLQPLPLQVTSLLLLAAHFSTTHAYPISPRTSAKQSSLG